MPTAQLRTRVDGIIPHSVGERRKTVPEANVPRAPQLREPTPNNIRSFSVPVSSSNQLPIFKGSPSSLDDCLKMLRQPTCSVEYLLRVDVRKTDVGTSAHAPCVNLGVQELSLVVENDEHSVCTKNRCTISRLLPLLTLPALQTFQLDQHHNAVIDFLHRHSSHLLDLRMEYPPASSLPFLALHALTNLRMYPPSRPVPTFTQDFFGRLEADALFLPSLQHIELPCFDSRERADFESMGRALLVRWNRPEVATIHSLRLDIDLARWESLAHFQLLLRPLTGLEAAGVPTRVEIRTRGQRSNDEYAFESESEASSDEPDSEDK
ncbi:hypothetical protein B0H17DRAFT_1178756 [Mycena rosella]|uniref:Uncharacterized protein n=1 Tax=Mycena rosella TaxID=1033263 RepID=A0AAD7DL16_MYCRO|nr:hypothetical protein B0H17DRAFT_1178756 [Mycena rosella]